MAGAFRCLDTGASPIGMLLIDRLGKPHRFATEKHTSQSIATQQLSLLSQNLAGAFCIILRKSTLKFFRGCNLEDAGVEHAPVRVRVSSFSRMAGLPIITLEE